MIGRRGFGQASWRTRVLLSALTACAPDLSGDWTGTSTMEAEDEDFRVFEVELTLYEVACDRLVGEAVVSDTEGSFSIETDVSGYREGSTVRLDLYAVEGDRALDWSLDGVHEDPSYPASTREDAILGGCGGPLIDGLGTNTVGGSITLRRDTAG